MIVLIVGLLISVSFGIGRCEMGFDSLVDELMINLNKDLTEKSMCNISISNLKFPVSKSFLYLIPVDAEVELTGGSVAQICTLTRTGDVTIQSLENDTVSLELNLGLGSLAIAFNDVYAYALFGIYSKDFGSLYATPADNAISVVISVTYPRTVECSTSVTSLSVTLGQLKVDLNGQPDTDLESTANVDLKSFANTINNEVTSKLSSILEEFDICNKIVDPPI